VLSWTPSCDTASLLSSGPWPQCVSNHPRRTSAAMCPTCRARPSALSVGGRAQNAGLRRWRRAAGASSSSSLPHPLLVEHVGHPVEQPFCEGALVARPVLARGNVADALVVSRIGSSGERGRPEVVVVDVQLDDRLGHGRGPRRHRGDDVRVGSRRVAARVPTDVGHPEGCGAPGIAVQSAGERGDPREDPVEGIVAVRAADEHPQFFEQLAGGGVRGARARGSRSARTSHASTTRMTAVSVVPRPGSPIPRARQLEIAEHELDGAAVCRRGRRTANSLVRVA
jgi:hypothetical protein